jgi:hypothetical protein
MAPRLVLKKYRPVSRALRQGVQDGAFTKALRNSTPRAATASMFGVFTTWFGDGRVSWRANTEA